MLAVLARFLGGGVLDRVLDTVDRKVRTETDREKIKGDIIKAHYASRSAWMKAGGFWLCLLFALPLAFWFASVVVYSVFWCSGCAFPQTWTIAALPAPLDEWAGMMIVSLFGVIGISNLRK